MSLKSDVGLHYFVLQIVKCNDRSCCSEPRSNYFKLFRQFVPAPLCVTQNELQIHDNSEETNDFVSLFIRARLNDDHLKIGKIKEVPYDFCCPSIKELIAVRTCEFCGLYHATLKSLAAHRRLCKSKSSQRSTSNDPPIIPRVRPQRIAAKRQKEKMVIWTSRLNDKHVDWFDEDEVEVIEHNETETGESSVIPVVDIDKYMENVWEEVKE